MDVAGHINERPHRLFELDNQTRPNANYNPAFRTHISRSFRRCVLSVAGNGRHTKTAAEVHNQRPSGGRSVYHCRSTAVENSRKIITFCLS